MDYYATLSRTTRSPVAGAVLSIVFGKASPTAINHANPGTRVSGTSKSAFGMIKLSQLNSPQIARAIPGTTIHLGSNFRNAAGIEIPAISKPNRTDNPDRRVLDPGNRKRVPRFDLGRSPVVPPPRVRRTPLVSVD